MPFNKNVDELRIEAARIQALGDDAIVGSEVRDFAQSVLTISRGRLPRDRASITKRFELRYVDQSSPHKTKRILKLYLTAGMYDDDTFGELFIKAEDRLLDGESLGEESAGATTPLTVGALDALAMAISVGVQAGCPLHTITSKLRHNRFGPNGFTGDAEIPSYTSVFDLIAQWLEIRFPDGKLVKKGLDR